VVGSVLMGMVGLAMAGEWSQQPIAPKALPDGTAYTLGTQTWRLGLVKQQVGVLDNVDIGTRAPLWVLGLPNGHAKITAIQTQRVDASIDGEVITTGLDRFGVPGGRLTLYPVGWTASWMISNRFSLHGGTGWAMGSVEGELTAAQLADAIGSSSGADLGDVFVDSLGDTRLYGGANVTLFQTRLQAEVRLNRRDSIVLRSTNWLYVNALVAATAGKEIGENGTEVDAGASARVRVPLTDSLQALTTLSWQFQWRRASLRVGIPLPFDNTFAWLQAVDAYVLLGKSRKKASPSP